MPIRHSSPRRRKSPGAARALQAGKTPNPELDVRLSRLGIPRQSLIKVLIARHLEGAEG